MSDTEMIQKYSQLVYALALSRTGQPSDAEDVYQEVFLKYVQTKPDWKDEHHAEAWFASVTLNITKNKYKAAQNRQTEEMEAETLENIVLDEDFVGDLETKLVFEEIMNQMNPKYSTVLLLRFDYGYTVKEIAQLLGETESNVKVLLMRGKRQYKALVLEMKGGREA